MDIISHGLWGGGLFGTNRKLFWISFAFGILPDFSAFSLPFITRILSMLSGNGSGFLNGGHLNFPDFVHSIYNVSHSLIIFSICFALVWYFMKKPFLPMIAWGFHIFLDIFTHTKEFFPTPFLWPVSDYHFDGISWGTPVIFLTNIVFLVVLYTILYIQSRKRKKWPK